MPMNRYASLRSGSLFNNSLATVNSPVNSCEDINHTLHSNRDNVISTHNSAVSLIEKMADDPPEGNTSLEKIVERLKRLENNSLIPGATMVKGNRIK
jgi:hypothetical protein